VSHNVTLWIIINEIEQKAQKIGLGLEKAALDRETQQLSEETHLETLARELGEKLPSKPE
jgi:hypothetical protein